MGNRSGGWLSLLVGVLLIAGGVWLSYAIGAPIIDTAKASLAWPTTEGTIETSELKTEYVGGQNARTEYRPVVHYKYTLNGQTYHSNNIVFGDGSAESSRSDGQEIVDRYPVGKQVQVHYDPQKPENAVLEPGVSFSTYTVFVWGWFIVGVGVLALWLGQRALRSPQPEQSASALEK